MSKFAWFCFGIVVVGALLIVIGDSMTKHTAISSTRPAVTSQPLWVDEGRVLDVRPVYNNLASAREAIVTAVAERSTTNVYIWVDAPVSVTDWNANVSLCPAKGLVKIGSHIYSYETNEIYK